MNIFKVLFIVVISLVTTTAFSQVKFGINIGGNLATNMFEINHNFRKEPETLSKLGFQVGLISDITLIKNSLSLQPELLYVNKGYSVDIEKLYENSFNNFDDYEGYWRVHYNYFEMPINLVYKNSGFQLSAGPYIAIGINGNMEHDFLVRGDGIEYNSENTFDKDIYKLEPVFDEVGDDKYEKLLDDEDVLELYQAFDFGLNFGIGYQVNHILFNASYSAGLVNMTPIYNSEKYNIDEDYTENTIQKNSVFTLSVSYFFN